MTSEPRLAYETMLGKMWHGDALDVLRRLPDDSVNLVVTSPPFALAKPKAYGNEAEAEYVAWLHPFAAEIHRVLAQDGSLVLDLGGAWLPGSPTKSLYQWRVLIDLVDGLGFHLAQDFYWFNRAKLPGPAQWVTVDRVRVKDAVNTIWWLSKSAAPKANNRNVLVPYSKSMERMLATGKYNQGKRPGGHYVGAKWARDNGGAIAPNVLEVDAEARATARSGDAAAGDGPGPNDVILGDIENLFDSSNTDSRDPYHEYCRSRGLERHPARFPKEIPGFFIKFLSAEGDLVLDPFAGSNVTGALCERLARRWISVEIADVYVRGSVGRFDDVGVTSHLDTA
jgi:DNA modification methylase